uniref:Uncharacterized protein n=1 Tax=Neobodo designis TaxID=312471 RepID=A0A7S1LY43_NEODS|mmetsp:Transcript_29248/g.90399  ORF Transcript_29248/g.90399 Transcript_29248/m.90399 type:complete len:207 (+) Transcript_29248:149-769(+)
MTDSSTPTTASSSRPGTRNGTTSRTELLEARKRQLLEKNATTFGQRQARSHEVAGRVHVKPYVVPEPPPSSQASRTARFHPGQIFRDASPPRESHTGLPAIPSVRRRLAADQQTADKPNGLLGSCSSSPRYLRDKLPSTTRPNTGTLNDGAPMYSCFSSDTVFRGDLPRGSLELTMGLTFGGDMSGTPRGVFKKGLEKPISRTLIR